jgi:flagellar biosynthesis/type III secretory pathway protein FliH
MGRIIKRFGQVVPAAVIDARTEAEAIVRDARARAAEALEAARRQGLEEGRAQGLASLAGLLAAGRAEADAMLARARPAALAVAARMAEKIVGRAVQLDPKIMAAIAAEALEACRTRAGVVQLRVHPDDLAALEPARAALGDRLGGEATLELVADEGVGRHGCVVDTSVGRVDARLATQVEALRRALLEDDARG